MVDRGFANFKYSLMGFVSDQMIRSPKLVDEHIDVGGGYFLLYSQFCRRFFLIGFLNGLSWWSCAGRLLHRQEQSRRENQGRTKPAGPKLSGMNSVCVESSVRLVPKVHRCPLCRFKGFQSILRW